MSVPKQTALVLGATGATGKYLLKELLNSQNYTRVGEFGRRTTPLDTPGLTNTEKLVQKVVDFEKPQEAGFADEKWDVVFIAMGTTKKAAGSAEKFIKIDQDYVVNAAEAARNASINQRLIYVSVGAANPSSPLLYLKSKGETEQRLAATGYNDTMIFRPGNLLDPERSEPRLLESISNAIAKRLASVTDGVGIPVSALAKALRIAGELGSSGLPVEAAATQSGGAEGKPQFTIIPNRGALYLSRMNL